MDLTQLIAIKRAAVRRSQSATTRVGRNKLEKARASKATGQNARKKRRLGTESGRYEKVSPLGLRAGTRICTLRHIRYTTAVTLFQSVSHLHHGFVLPQLLTICTASPRCIRATFARGISSSRARQHESSSSLSDASRIHKFNIDLGFNHVSLSLSRNNV